MVYKTCSVKEVIGRIARNTRITDSSYIEDLLEWIPEGINKLQTHFSLITCYKNLEIKNNTAKLPCGLVSIEAVLYKDKRLILTGFQGTSDFILSNELESQGAIFTPDTNGLLKNNLQERINGTYLRTKDINSSHYYKLQLDYIQTSFNEGNITIFYTKQPVDCDGYPMIPDNDNYKEALYWYCLMKMMEAGYEHSIFDWRHCWNMWENIYLPRAIGEIKYPDVDRYDRLHRATVRLIPPFNYYEDLF